MKLLNLGTIIITMTFVVSSPAAAPTVPAVQYESVGRILVIHQGVVEGAAPVSMETAAATHAALFPTSRFVESVLTPHAAQLSAIRPAGTTAQWAEAVSRNVTVVAKPSLDSSRGCVIEFRCRSANLGEAGIVAYLMATAYEGFLNAAPLEAAATAASIRQAMTLRDDATRARDELRPQNNPSELARAEHRLREAEAELQRLQLKARYGNCQVIVLQYPKQATRVTGP